MQNQKTAKNISKLFDAVLIPKNPKFTDLQKLTKNLSEHKMVVGFLRTLAKGWQAPSHTKIIIHSECEKMPDYMELVTNAKLLPKPFEENHNEIVIAEYNEDMKKKKRIESLEYRLKTLLKAIEPFTLFTKGFLYHGMKIAEDSKSSNLMIEDSDGNFIHYGKYSNIKEIIFSKAFITLKKYDPEKPINSYLGSHPLNVADLSVSDFLHLDNVVKSMLSIKPEDATSGVSVKEAEKLKKEK